ncbi:hypothetical protein [Xanthomonas sp. NCPPB 1128]|uniref:hypothetical protein n=1 Tax=Xanthomonas sp. NCPPB 1128 TaxID=1775876 RepID=UPI0012FF395C|nr:hypothetical protein [Xanthomonas sp. NCPPB 1128]
MAEIEAFLNFSLSIYLQAVRRCCFLRCALAGYAFALCRYRQSQVTGADVAAGATSRRASSRTQVASVVWREARTSRNAGVR